VSEPARTAWVRAGLLLVLVFFLIFGLLYAYRAQAPAAKEITYSEALLRIQRGEVASVSVIGSRATIELRDGQRFEAVVPDRDERLAQTVMEWNRTQPERPTTMRFESGPAFPGVILSVVLSLLPIVLLVALVFLAVLGLTRVRAPERYEMLARLADLRDRGALTEEEFQREKRKVLR
jgi:ATP-dependent Zn protease